MRVVRVARRFPGSVHEAQKLWYDTSRWATWIDGLSHVAKVDGPWPESGAKVIWDSHPAGRGRVVERVVAYEALAGQSLEVEDKSIRGRQTIVFTPADSKVDVELTLEYEIKNRSILTPLIDLLFIRRAMISSLGGTLNRFGVELAAERAADGGH
jgi:polyketide cyclase/dehydrase/lipid transport protein